jgi:hypothetical protein
MDDGLTAYIRQRWLPRTPEEDTALASVIEAVQAREARIAKAEEEHARTIRDWERDWTERERQFAATSARVEQLEAALAEVVSLASGYERRMAQIASVASTSAPE